AYYAGIYDRHYKRGGVLRSTIVATVTLLTAYALLPEQYRFSRAIVVFGALMAFLLLSLQRWLLVRAGLLAGPTDASSKPYIIIAASESEYESIENFLTEKGFGERIIGRVGINGSAEKTLAHIDNIATAADALNAKELIFCATTFSYKRIIALTENLHTRLKLRYHAYGSSSIVGSDTSTESGEVLTNDIDFAIARSSNKRMKRLIDVVFAIVLLLTFPFHLLFVKNPLQLLFNSIAIVFAKRTWVGYISQQATLPPLRKSILAPNGRRELSYAFTDENIYLLNYWYARNYEPVQDIKTIFSHYRYLGS
ncbi:MAG TPA: hypothetical protein VER36_11195, partial [Flavisolibacter sp.]|nr:hypothetical protein [Flavisolibacter sp.]